MDCSKITIGLQAVNCGQPATAGTGPRVILLNYADIDRKESVVIGNVIESIGFKGKIMMKGYEFESLDKANVGEISYNGFYFFNRLQVSGLVKKH